MHPKTTCPKCRDVWCHFFESTGVSTVGYRYFEEKNRSAPISLRSFARQLAKCWRVYARYRRAYRQWGPGVRLEVRYEDSSQRVRAWDARRRLTFIEVPVEPVGGTRRRPGITAQISATPVQDLSPFPEPGQSALASHRPSRCEGGTAPELRFSTFLSQVYIYSRQLSVYSPFALSRTMFSRTTHCPLIWESLSSLSSSSFFFPLTDTVHTSRNIDELPPPPKKNHPKTRVICTK